MKQFLFLLAKIKILVFRLRVFELKCNPSLFSFGSIHRLLSFPSSSSIVFQNRHQNPRRKSAFKSGEMKNRSRTIFLFHDLSQFQKKLLSPLHRVLSWDQPEEQIGKFLDFLDQENQKISSAKK